MYLNKLNLRIQGRNQTIASLYDFLHSFRKKKILFRDNIQKHSFLFFPSCDIISKEVSDNDFTCFVEIINVLIEDFGTRLNDFKNFQKSFSLFNATRTVPITDVEEVFQLELCELQSNQNLLVKSNLPIVDFWHLLSIDRFPNIRRFGLRLVSMFGSSYV